MLYRVPMITELADTEPRLLGKAQGIRSCKLWLNLVKGIKTFLILSGFLFKDASCNTLMTTAP